MYPKVEFYFLKSCVSNAAAVTSVVSDSMRPHPWDSPGKNTGVGCYFLLQCIKVKSERSRSAVCPTVCDPMDCSPPGSSVHGILQARGLAWAATAFSVCQCMFMYIENY